MGSVLKVETQLILKILDGVIVGGFIVNSIVVCQVRAADCVPCALVEQFKFRSRPHSARPGCVNGNGG